MAGWASRWTRATLSAAFAAHAALAAGAAWAGEAEVLALGPAGLELQGKPSRLGVSVTPALGFTALTAPGQDIGLQWRQPVLNDHRIDITAWRRVHDEPTDALSLIRQRDPTFGARMEFKVGGKRRGFMADYRFLGLQLDNGARIGLRRKNGNPTLYYRASF
jgi:hypothetical protein